MMIDVDFFKSFNDTKGHLYGDEVLRQIARTINESFARDTDAVYRYGGEEFCVALMADDNLERQVADLQERVRALGIAAQNASVSQTLTVSVGIAVCSSQDATLDQLLACADAQLYVSKTTGRDRATIRRLA